MSDFCRGSVRKVSGFSRKMSKFLSDFCRGSVGIFNNYEKLHHDLNPASISALHHIGDSKIPENSQISQ